MIKDKWVIFTSSEGVYEFDFQNFQITPCRELKINNGKVIHDNYGDCWAYNNTGRIYYINSKSGEIKNFQLIPEEKMKYIDYERYHVVRDDRGLCGFQLMETDFSPTIFRRTGWNTLFPKGRMQDL